MLARCGYTLSQKQTNSISRLLNGVGQCFGTSILRLPSFSNTLFLKRQGHAF